MANTRIIIYLFIIISTFIKCVNRGNCENASPNNEHDCFDRISEDDKEDEYHCCFLLKTMSSGTTNRECVLLEKDDYYDIEGYKDDLLSDKSSGLDDVDIECHQSYIKFDKYKYLMITLLNLVLLIIM